MYLFSTPNEPKTSDIIRYSVSVFFGAALLAAFSLLYLDHDLTFLFKDDDWKWQMARDITNIGLFENYFVPAFLIWATTFTMIRLKLTSINKESLERLCRQTSWLMYCLLFSGLFTHLIKPIVGRQRPSVSPNFDAHVFHPLTTFFDPTGYYHSMPSGHAQVLFTVATFFAFLMPKYKYGLYLVAFLLALTRVMTRDHFYSDVLMGAAIGHVSTIALIFWLSRRYNINRSSFTT